MIVVLVLAATGFAAGAWLLASTIFPAPPDLARALDRLHDHRPMRTVTPSTAPSASTLVLLGRRLLDRASLDVLVGESTLADLEVVRRPLEVHAGACATGAVAGALAGPLLWAPAAALGLAVPLAVPALLVPVGAAAGFLAPRVELRARAARAREDFRHALGAYLDVLVLLLAGGEGPESAMRAAAHAGDGPAFMELRRATTQAAYSGAVWDALDDVGRRVGIIELREIASTGSLAGEGAAVRRSLVAKARSLRTSTLAAQEIAARKRSQAMFAPIVLIGFAFVVFLLYPLVTNLKI